MIAGFDLNSPLVCEGIVGDGCGGGRIFYIEDEKLKVYDPTLKMSSELLEDVFNATNISKSACIVRITCKGEMIEFNLSSLQRV